MTNEFNNVVIIKEDDNTIIIEDIIEHVPVTHDWEMG